MLIQDKQNRFLASIPCHSLWYKNLDKPEVSQVIICPPIRGKCNPVTYVYYQNSDLIRRLVLTIQPPPVHTTDPCSFQDYLTE
jgi:hypothetical protein